jgi:Mobilization protein NikA
MRATRDEIIRIRVTAAEKQAYQAAADRADRWLSEWLRMAANDTVKLEEAVEAEREVAAKQEARRRALDPAFLTARRLDQARN